MIFYTSFATSKTFKYRDDFEKVLDFFVKFVKNDDIVDEKFNYELFYSNDFTLCDKFVELKKDSKINEIKKSINKITAFYFYIKKEKFYSLIQEQRNKYKLEILEKIKNKIANTINDQNDLDYQKIIDALKGIENSYGKHQDLKHLCNDYLTTHKKTATRNDKEEIVLEIKKMCSFFVNNMDIKTIDGFLVVMGKNGIGNITCIGHNTKDISESLGVEKETIGTKFDINTINNDLYNKSRIYCFDTNVILTSHSIASNAFYDAFYESCSKHKDYKKIFISKNKDKCHQEVISNRECKQTIFQKLEINQKLKNYFFNASCFPKLREPSSREMAIFESVKQFFNLCSYAIAYEKQYSFSTLNEIVENIEKKSKLQLATGSNANKQTLENYSEFENCNIYSTSERTVISVCPNLLFNLPESLTKDTLGRYVFINPNDFDAAKIPEGSTVTMKVICHTYGEEKEISGVIIGVGEEYMNFYDASAERKTVSELLNLCNGDHLIQTKTYIVSGTIKNINSSHYGNFELSDGKSSIKVYGATQTKGALAFDNSARRYFVDEYGTVKNTKAWSEYCRLSDNHTYRYMAESYYKTLLSCQIIIIMKKMAYVSVKKKASNIASVHYSSLLRMRKIHELVCECSRIDIFYNCEYIFHKEKNIKMYGMLMDKYSLAVEERENIELLQSLWQDSNIANGWYIPFISLIITLVGFIAEHYCIYYSTKTIEDNVVYEKVYSFTTIALTVVTILLFLIVFILIPRIKKNKK